MSFFEFPHTRTYDNDLGWLIKKVKEISDTVENFVSYNEIKYADPIQWSITEQYQKNTVVVDPQTGTAYISVANVPNGVLLTDTEYWSPIFNYAGGMDELRTYVENAIADIEDSIAGISGVYADVKDFGAVGDGVTDDSAAFQAAFDNGKVVYVPRGVYVVHGVTASGDKTIIGADEAVIQPYYVNGIAQNVFTFTAGGAAIVKNLQFIGSLHGTVDTSVQRQSTIEIVNYDCAMVEDCIFDSIDNSDTAIENLAANRRGICMTMHDVGHSVVSHVIIRRVSRDEAVWIAPQTLRAMSKTFVDIVNCHSDHFGGWSIYDVIADRVNVFRYVSDSTDNTGGASLMNLLCNNIVVRQCMFHGRSSDVIDNREANAFFGNSAVIEDCWFDNYTSVPLLLFAKNIQINRCYFKGRSIIQCVNTPTSDQSVIEVFGPIAYTTRKDIDRIIIKDCKFEADNSISGTSWISMVYTNYTNAEIDIENCDVDCNSINGSCIWTHEARKLSVQNCKFRNAGSILSSSSIHAYMDIGVNTKKIELVDNDIDAMLCALFATGCEEMVIRGNAVNAYTGYVADNLTAANKVGKLVTDTVAIRVHSDNFGTQNGSWSVSAWSAASSSAFGAEVTERLSLARGLYLIVVSLPLTSAAIPVRLRNFTANQDVGPVMTVNTSAYESAAAAFVASVDDTELGLITQGSTTVTYSGTSTASVTAIPIKF